MPGPHATPPPHGTRRRYQFRRRPCRCAECRAANRTYVYSRRVINARSGTDQPLAESGTRRPLVKGAG